MNKKQFRVICLGFALVLLSLTYIMLKITI